MVNSEAKTKAIGAQQFPSSSTALLVAEQVKTQPLQSKTLFLVGELFCISGSLGHFTSTLTKSLAFV